MSAGLLRVHVLDDSESVFLDHLRQELDDSVCLTAGPVNTGAPRFEVLVAGRPDRKALEYSPDLKRLVIPFAGLPEETRTLLLEYPSIQVHNLHHNARTTAELGLALLLAASKNLLGYDRALRSGDWTPRYEGDPGILLQGRSVVVLGFGAVGREAGLLCRALGMDVIGIRSSPDPGETWRGIHVRPSSSLEEELRMADVLLLAVPLTDDTRGMIGERQLKLLRTPSIVINIARGPVIDEKALYEALTDGTVYAAGLDVWYSYPSSRESRTSTIPASYPFHELSNVVMSPHRGGHADNTEAVRAADLAQLLNAASQGKEIWNKVNLELGY